MVGHCNRTKSDLIYQVLKAVNEAKPPTKTRIMYSAMLSYPQIRDYTLWLIESQLINYDNNLFALTPKGLDYMKTFEAVESMFKCAEPPKPIPKQKLNSIELEFRVRDIMSKGLTNSYEIARVLHMPRGTVWHKVLKIKKEQSTRTTRKDDKLRLGRSSK